MLEDLPIQGGIVIPGSELSYTASRSGGPGGQNVNKVSTRVTLRWSPGASVVLDGTQRERVIERLRGRITAVGEILIHCDEERSQPRNLEIARERLAVLVRGALRVPRRRRPTRPTRASKERRIASKKRRGETKRMRVRAGADD